LDTLDRVRTGKQMDGIEESLLDKIVLQHDKQEPIFVGDLISLSELGSQATLHGRIKNLQANGYIKLIADKLDGRKKLVIPTKQAMRHYEKYSQYLLKASLTI
jgi:DNA-binding MarR family transcriptional regulator